MAGDKQYFYHANQLMKQMNIKLLFICGNVYEKTDFKSGFCGISPKNDNTMSFYKLKLFDSIKLAWFYLKEYIQNPKYINSSLLDTIGAFFSYYFIPHKYLNLYQYIDWNEDTVNKVLKKYGWEFDKEINSSWRIGDGTAAIYNYIYYTIAGLTEFDTFESNLIRTGKINRNQALSVTIKNNKPRLKSLLWYTNTINTSLKQILSVVHKNAL